MMDVLMMDPMLMMDVMMIDAEMLMMMDLDAPGAGGWIADRHPAGHAMSPGVRSRGFSVEDDRRHPRGGA